MPPAAIAAGIAGGSQIIGGIIGSRSAGKAREAQERANAEALAFSREQAEADRAYRQQLFNAWLNQRNALLSRYGIDIPGLGAGAMAPGPGAVPRGAPPPAAGAPAVAPPSAGPPVGAPPGGGPPRGLAFLTGASPGMFRAPGDWTGLGLRR